MMKFYKSLFLKPIALEEATKEENLREHPWIIVVGHRPLYCSVNDDPDMCKHSNMVRTGLPGINVSRFSGNHS